MSASSLDGLPDLASQAGLRRIAVAVDDRTVIGQPLPEGIQQEWTVRVRSLVQGSPSTIQVVTDPTEADWLVQIAALERTDILYLAPSDRRGTPVEDDQLRMSPPGELAIEWLQFELEQISRDANFVQIAEGETRPDALPVEPDREAIPEPSPAPPTENLDAKMAAIDQAIAASEQELRRGYEEVRKIREKGVSASSTNHADTAAAAVANDRLVDYLERERQRYEELKRYREAQFAMASASKVGAIFGGYRRGPAEDLKADIVEEQSGIYQTPNRTQAVLGSYGKIVEGNHLLHRLAKFEHRGSVQQVDQLRRFTTVQRKGSGNGEDFVSLVGKRQAWQFVELAGQISGGRHQELTFEILGVRLDQNDVINALNADDDALDYFEYLRQQKQTPCLVLENLVFTSYAAAHGSSFNADAKAKIELTSDGIEGQVESQSGSFTQLTSPVIRGYQAYEVKLHGRKVMELVNHGP